MLLSKTIVATFVATRSCTTGAVHGVPPKAFLKAISKQRRAARRARSKASPGANPDKAPAGAEASADAARAARPGGGRAPAGLPADEGVLAFRGLAGLGGTRPAFKFDDECTVGYVDCVDGVVNGSNPAVTCMAACDGKCCTEEIYGWDPCNGFTGKVCQDGSCDGRHSCIRATIPHVVASCDGVSACSEAGGGGTGSIGSLFNSCRGDEACRLAGNGNHHDGYGQGSGSGHGSVGDVINSCQAQEACTRLGHGYVWSGGSGNGSVGHVFNSCNGHRACHEAGHGYGLFGATATGSVGNIYNACNAFYACYQAGSGYANGYIGSGIGTGSIGNIVNACKARTSCNKTGYRAVLDSSLVNCCYDEDECEADYSLGDLPDACTATASPSKSPSTSPSTSNPSASPSASPTTAEPSKSPSTSPSTSNPSASPSASPTTNGPSRSPSASPSTAGPSASPSASPTTDRPSNKSPSDTPWSIDFVDLDVDFSPLSERQVSLKYDIGKDLMYETSLLQKDCVSSIEDVTVNSTASKVNKNATHDTVTVNHSIDKSAIAGSSITNGDSDQLNVCQFFKLILPGAGNRPDMVIIEDRRQVEIDFSLSVNYSVANELGPGRTETAAGETNVSSYLEAFKCSGVNNFTEDPDALVPNTQLHVCVKSVSADVEIQQLVNMVVAQGAANMTVVREGSVVISSIADVTYDEPANGVVVTTFIPTNIFTYTAGASINISGAIDMQLAGSNRRLLANSFEGDIPNAGGGAKASYELSVDLQDELIAIEEDNAWLDSSAYVVNGVSVLFGMALLYLSGM